MFEEPLPKQNLYKVGQGWGIHWGSFSCLKAHLLSKSLKNFWHGSKLGNINYVIGQNYIQVKMILSFLCLLAQLFMKKNTLILVNVRLENGTS